MPLTDKDLLKAIPKAQPFEFDLSNRPLSRADIAKIVAFLNTRPTITKLTLQNCAIDPEGAALLATLEHVTMLYVCKNPLGSEGVSHLIKNQNFCSLDIADCNIGDEGALLLASAHQITHLCVDNNGITHIGAEALATHPNLRHLNISKNPIGDRGKEALSLSPSLINVDTTHCDVPKDLLGFIPTSHVGNLERDREQGGHGASFWFSP